MKKIICHARKQPLAALQTYWDSLSKHDWDYRYSEDPGVYQRGREDEGMLSAQSRTSPAHEKLFKEFERYRDGKRKSMPMRAKP